MIVVLVSARYQRILEWLSHEPIESIKTIEVV